MRKTLRKKLVCMLMMAALLLSAAITYAQPASADNLNADEVNRFNVILVIDGSGSLVSGSSATDKSGLRYDAINLFLALLTNDGNQVGAIVFDDDSNNYLLNTGLTPVSGKGDKVSLGEKIRSAGTRNDTDIGSALLSAVSILEASGSQDGRSRRWSCSAMGARIWAAIRKPMSSRWRIGRRLSPRPRMRAFPFTAFA